MILIQDRYKFMVKMLKWKNYFVISLSSCNAIGLTVTDSKM